MDIPTSAAEPPDKKETILIPLIQIENPFYGKPYLSPYEALEIINILSEHLKDYEQGKPPRE